MNNPEIINNNDKSHSLTIDSLPKEAMQGILKKLNEKKPKGGKTI